MDFVDPIERQKWVAPLVANAKGHARKAGRPFELTTEFVETLYARQGGRCEVTGLQFSRQRFPDALVKHPFAPSIDRRSSSGGYTKDNVRLVCVAVNFGMGQWGEEVFLTLARAAADHEKRARLESPPISMPGKPDTESVSPPPSVVGEPARERATQSTSTHSEPQAGVDAGTGGVSEKRRREHAVPVLRFSWRTIFGVGIGKVHGIKPEAQRFANRIREKPGPNRRIDLTHRFLPLYAYEAQLGGVPCLKNGRGLFRKLKDKRIGVRRYPFLGARHCKGDIVLTASAAVSPTPRAVGWSLKLSMSCNVNSPAGMSARIFSMTRS
jgi:hypothetical protein